MSNQDYIKRLPLATYRLQRRGGKGVIGMVTREADVVRHLVVADTHDNLLLFTDRGRVYRLKAYQVPQDLSRATKGTALVNLLSIDLKEHITALIAVTAFTPDTYLLMVTAKGLVKKTPLEEYASVRSNGLIAIGLRSGDELVAASLVDPNDEVLLATCEGKATRFNVDNVRPLSRTATGVRGIKLVPGDRVVGMAVVTEDNYLVTVAENGFGKLTRVARYPVHRRGGKGVINHRVNERTGKVVGARQVTLDQHLTIVSVQGNVIRIPVEGVRICSRSSQGVYVMKLDPGDKVAAVAVETDDMGSKSKDGTDSQADVAR